MRVEGIGETSKVGRGEASARAYELIYQTVDPSGKQGPILAGEENG